MMTLNHPNKWDRQHHLSAVRDAADEGAGDPPSQWFDAEQLSAAHVIASLSSTYQTSTSPSPATTPIPYIASTSSSPPRTTKQRRTTSGGRRNKEKENRQGWIDVPNNGMPSPTPSSTTQQVPICKECGASFNRVYDLHRHMRRHLGSEGVRCETCGKQFTRRDALLRHLRRKLHN
ncbi:uncharacterized protein VTP21DRAFT_2133 [Calcarisporiella thermophila]|uniref:uncharacterized protein n=1 Tax=Calcarisporiella thermophila TaxID=911321 RepID=UPI003743018E